MRSITFTFAMLVGLAVPVLSQTAPAKTGTTTEPTVRVPASPFTGTSFLLDRPMTSKPENALGNGPMYQCLMFLRSRGWVCTDRAL